MTMILSGPAFEKSPEAPSTLASLILQRVHEYPDALFVEIDQAGRRSTRSTGDLHCRAVQILDTLRALPDFSKSDIVVCNEHLFDYLAAIWACVYGGLRCLPWYMPRTASSRLIASRLAAVSKRLNQPVLVTTESIRGRIESVSSSPFRGVLEIDRELENSRVSESVFDASPSNISSGAFLLWTSGTGADPKIVIVPFACQLNRLLAMQSQMSHATTLFFGPFDSVGGLAIMVPRAGGNLFLQPERFAAKPAEILDLVEEFQLEAIGTSSSIAARIMSAPELWTKPRDLGCLKHVGFGQELIVPKIVLAFARCLRRMGADDLEISLGYGMTEAGLICKTPLLPADQIVTRLEKGPQPISVGACTSGYSLRIVDDKGSTLPPGVAGNVEIWSAEKLFSGYLNDPELDLRKLHPRRLVQNG